MANAPSRHYLKQKLMAMAPWLALRFPSAGIGLSAVCHVEQFLPTTRAGIYVAQNHYVIAPLSVPLATDSLKTCAALFVTDVAQQRHYLSHLDAAHPVEDIRASLAELCLESARVAIRPGSDAGTFQTIRNIMAALAEAGVSAEQISMLQRVQEGDGIAGYQNGYYIVDHPNLWKYQQMPNGDADTISGEVSPRGPWPWRRWQARFLIQ